MENRSHLEHRSFFTLRQPPGGITVSSKITEEEKEYYRAHFKEAYETVLEEAAKRNLTIYGGSLTGILGADGPQETRNEFSKCIEHLLEPDKTSPSAKPPRS